MCASVIHLDLLEELIISGHTDGTLRGTSFEGAHLWTTDPHAAPPLELLLHTDSAFGNSILTAGADGAVVATDGAQGTERWRVERGAPTARLAVTAMTACPDLALRLCVAWSDSIVCVINNIGESTHQFKAAGALQAATITALALDGHQLYVGCRETGSVERWSIGTEQPTLSWRSQPLTVDAEDGTDSRSSSLWMELHSTLLFCCQHGSVAAISRDSGALDWRVDCSSVRLKCMLQPEDGVLMVADNRGICSRQLQVASLTPHCRSDSRG